MMEIKLAMATLLSSFDIEDLGTQDGSDVQEVMKLTMDPNELRMRLRERTA